MAETLSFIGRIGEASEPKSCFVNSIKRDFSAMRLTSFQKRSPELKHVEGNSLVGRFIAHLIQDFAHLGEQRIKLFKELTRNLLLDLFQGGVKPQ